MFCVTTDLYTSSAVIHRNGAMWKYVRASMSLTGYLVARSLSPPPPPPPSPPSPPPSRLLPSTATRLRRDCRRARH